MNDGGLEVHQEGDTVRKKRSGGRRKKIENKYVSKKNSSKKREISAKNGRLWRWCPKKKK